MSYLDAIAFGVKVVGRSDSPAGVRAEVSNNAKRALPTRVGRAHCVFRLALEERDASKGDASSTQRVTNDRNAARSGEARESTSSCKMAGSRSVQR